MAVSVMWFRRDLRLEDQPAVAAAIAAGGSNVVPLFVVDPVLVGPSGPNRRHFLARTLEELRRETGGALVVRSGRPEDVVPGLAREVGAPVVTATADFGPYGTVRDRRVAERLGGQGAVLNTVGTPYAVAPGRARAANGAPLKVFTAYYRAWEKLGWPAPVSSGVPCWRSAPGDMEPAAIELGAARPGQHGLPDWWEGLPMGRAASLPPAGEQAALQRLEEFVSKDLDRYAEARDRPGAASTSKLSPYLHFGCVHPRSVLERMGTGRGAQRLRTELAWRDFYADVLWHKPTSARQSLQAFGRQLRWDTDHQAQERFRAWATGQTGYPMVDAAMRQLLAEGWVHNRARMVTASFLVKDLHLDWRLGARWFMWHLVDADLASNQHGWQWVAGTGTDAAPFFRVFNPQAQQERFDPDASYVQRYLPELSHAGGYPSPIVDHAQERREALDRFAEARGHGGQDQQ